MKRALIFLLLPLLAQSQPTRQREFLPEHQYNISESAVSPDGKKLLLSFNDKDKSTYELIDLLTLKLVATGSLPAKVTGFAWNEESTMVAVDYIGVPSQCYEVKTGMKLLMTTRDGASAFSRNTSLTTKQPTILYVFNEDNVYRYNMTNKTVDSTEQDEFELFSKAWFNVLNKNFCVLDDMQYTMYFYDEKGKQLKSKELDKIILQTDQVVDKNGSLYLYGDGKKLNVYDLYKDKLVYSSVDKPYYTATLTPDSRGILLKTKDGFEKINLETRQSATVSYPAYYQALYPISFGTELLCLNSTKLEIFTCKDYLPQPATPLVIKEKFLPPAERPPAKEYPKVTKTVPPAAPAKWAQPFTAADFLIPLQKDSVYMWTPDRSLKKAIVYKKEENSILWANAYSYYDYFGFSREAKFAQVNSYILDMTDSTARIASYAKYGLIEKPSMIGGQNMLVKVPPAGKISITWTNEMYGEKATYTAKVIDNTYKGVKAKCLVVSRKEVVNGQAIDETYFYQKGVGLIRIESEGKVYMER